MTMKEEQTILSHDPQQNFNIYKGYFGMIQRGDIIPVGGSIFSRYASEFLEIDETVEGSKIDRVKLERAYISQKDNLESWMQQAGITLSSELYFRLWNTLSKVQSTLKTDLPTDIQERKRYYTQKSTLRISELIGNTACAERAAL